MSGYFIDTADMSYITPLWDTLKKYDTLYTGFLGITTNPSAMSKIGVHTVEDFKKVVTNLKNFCHTASPNVHTTVFVQMPNDNMTFHEFDTWIELIKKLNEDVYDVTVGLKIPPYAKYLTRVRETGNDYHLVLNVTGVADAGTLFRVHESANLAYASLIPGRMEEVGINANAHMQSLLAVPDFGQRVITGAMRTLDGLRNSIRGGTVPTIGTRVFDLMVHDKHMRQFAEMWDLPKFDASDLPPNCDQRNIDLTTGFFTQMNELGAKLYADFRSTL